MSYYTLTNFQNAQEARYYDEQAREYEEEPESPFSDAEREQARAHIKWMNGFKASCGRWPTFLESQEWYSVEEPKA